jgi:hypothetical protein
MTKSTKKVCRRPTKKELNAMFEPLEDKITELKALPAYPEQLMQTADHFASFFKEKEDGMDGWGHIRGCNIPLQSLTYAQLFAHTGTVRYSLRYVQHVLR